MTTGVSYRGFVRIDVDDAAEERTFLIDLIVQGERERKIVQKIKKSQNEFVDLIIKTGRSNFNIPEVEYLEKYSVDFEEANQSLVSTMDFLSNASGRFFFKQDTVNCILEDGLEEQHPNINSILESVKFLQCNIFQMPDEGLETSSKESGKEEVLFEAEEDEKELIPFESQKIRDMGTRDSTLQDKLKQPAPPKAYLAEIAVKSMLIVLLALVVSLYSPAIRSIPVRIYRAIKSRGS